MEILRTIAGLIFIFLGVLVMYKGIQGTRRKGIRHSYVDIVTGIGFVFIGLLIWFRYIS